MQFKLPQWLTQKLAHKLIFSALLREPDLTIDDGNNSPYMFKWRLIPRNRFFNISVHKFLRSDKDTLHDHPWANCSVILKGCYEEHTIAQGGVNHYKTRHEGEFVLRLGHHAHRIMVNDPCWSLFITGPKYREWGFHCPNGWVHWEKFTDPGNYGKVGNGCN